MKRAAKEGKVLSVDAVTRLVLWRLAVDPEGGVTYEGLERRRGDPARSPDRRRPFLADLNRWARRSRATSNETHLRQTGGRPVGWASAQSRLFALDG